MKSSQSTKNKRLIVVGYTTKEHLLLDLDHTSFYKVTRLVKLIQISYPEVGAALILCSSQQKKERSTVINRKGIPRHIFKRESFHVVFDNKIGYEECTQIQHTLIDLNVIEPEFRIMRAKRGDMTLRASPVILSNRIKPAPVPYRTMRSFGYKQKDGMIKQYLAFSRSISRLFLTDDKTK